MVSAPARPSCPGCGATLAFCGHIRLLIAEPLSLLYLHESQREHDAIKLLRPDYVFLSRFAFSHCSHSCYPLPFNLGITWINCEAKTGWPILWWSAWAEMCTGRKAASFTAAQRRFLHVALSLFCLGVSCFLTPADYCDCFSYFMASYC